MISGGGSNMVKLVESMSGDHPARPCLVLSNIAGAGGLDKADALGVETATVAHKNFATREAFEEALHARLEQSRPDIICLAGFMRILTAGFVSKWEGRMLNIHPSLLPKYQGLNTHQRAIDAGDSLHGCSIHEVTALLDDGPIWGQATVRVQKEDTAEVLANRVLVQEHKLYPEVLRKFAAAQQG
nr:phosphoribosylglycinamide formyltransferase [Nereida sp. MMG025]